MQFVLLYLYWLLSLACNDDVHISLDAACNVYVTADMFLEGGPYSCYLTEYAVYFSDNPGVNVNDTTFPMAPGSYNVTVEDNATGNFCWGTFIVEDKIGPELECAELSTNCIEAACGLPTILVPGFNNDIGLRFFADHNQTINPGDPAPSIFDFNNPLEPGTNTYSAEFLGTCPDILDVNGCVVVNTTSTLANLTIVLIAPNGTQTNIWFPNGCSGGNTLDFCLDDEGNTAANLCNPFYWAGNQNYVTLAGFFPPLAPLYGGPATGLWQIQVLNPNNLEGDINVIAEVNGNDPSCSLQLLTVEGYLASQGVCGAAADYSGYKYWY